MNKISCSIVASIALFGTFSNFAFAACTTSDGGLTYTCSDTTATTQTISASPGNTTNVTIDSTFLNATPVTGPSVRVNTQATGDVTVTQAQGASGNSSMQGIHVTSMAPGQPGSGTITVDSAGTLNSTGNTGITVQQGVGATGSVSVEQLPTGVITAGTYGITVPGSQTTGNISITTAGSVTGTNNGGILASTSNAASTGTLSVTQTAGTITGKRNGIEVTNAGLGATTVTTSGSVMASGALYSWGIYARIINPSSTAPLTVSQTDGTITGSWGGLFASHRGTGATTVNAAGTIIAGHANGIHVYAFSNAAINISGSVTGGLNGVFLWGGDTASLTQTAQSSISGNNGIMTTVSGDTHITTAGSVTGTDGDGIYAGLECETETIPSLLTIDQTSGQISGSDNGIHVEIDEIEAANMPWHVAINTAGHVTGTQENGIFADFSYDDEILSSGSIAIQQSSGTISGGTNGIYVAERTEVWDDLTNTIIPTPFPVSIDIASTVTGGTGGGILTDTKAISPVSITLNSGADVSASSGTAIEDREASANLTMESGSKLSGKVLMGNGSDSMTVKGTADISGATLLDGGNSIATSYTDVTGTDVPITDILGTADGFTNTFTFLGATQSLAGAILTNWDTVNVDASNVTLTDGTLITGSEPGYGLFLKNSATLNSPATLAVTGNVDIDASSTLNQFAGGSITGNVTNAGLINWGNTTPGQTLSINGNYSGVSGSTLSLGTYLGDDSSATDKLYVTGDTSGTTAITVKPDASSPGAQTVNGIDIVQVDGNSAGIFTLASPAQAGAYEYVLQQGNAIDANDWYLVSTYNCALNNSCPVTPGTPIYRPSVGNYISAQMANTMQGMFQLSTLHQRIGEQRVVDQDGRQTWVRPYYYNQNMKGKTQFGYDSDIAGVQVGQEVFVKHDDQNTTQRIAMTFDRSFGNADFEDRLRPFADLSADTGSMDAKSTAIGITYTLMDKDGGYIDIVGQLSLLRNEFKDSNGDESTQEGLRGALSIEAGKPIAKLGIWSIEPQIQLIYMNTHYQGFDDSVSHIDGYTADALRGRIGARIFTDSESTVDKNKQYYGIINLIHDFTEPDSVTIGDTTIDETFSQTYFEAGIGTQQQIKEDFYFYGDIRYQYSLEGEDSNGLAVNLGLKYIF